jgi:hypothetical protein
MLSYLGFIVKIASTSTDTFLGSDATPTAALAWRPASAKILTIKSDAPFATIE